MQIDTFKVAIDVYQQTTIDDFSRSVVAELHHLRTVSNMLSLLELLLDTFCVPIQCVQGDRGSEFVVLGGQSHLRELHIACGPDSEQFHEGETMTFANGRRSYQFAGGD